MEDNRLIRMLVVLSLVGIVGLLGLQIFLIGNVSGLRSEMDKDEIQQQLKSQKMSTDKMQEEIVARLDNVETEVKKGILQLLAQDSGIPQNLESVTIGQKAAGIQALELGLKAMDEAQYQSAFAIFANGINHAPGNMKLISGLADCAVDSGDPDLLAHVLSILDIALYQVSPGDMEKVVALMSRVQAAIPVENVVPEATLVEIETDTDELLGSGKPKQIWLMPESIGENMAQLEALQEQLAERDPQNPRIQEIQARTDVLGAMVGVSPVCLHVEECIKKIDSELAKNSLSVPYLNSLISAANGAVYQLAGQSFDDFPGEVVTRIREYPTLIQRATDEVNRRLSEEPYRQAIAEASEALGYGGWEISPKIDFCKEKRQVILGLSQKVYCEEYASEISDTVKKLDDNIRQLELERYMAYQKWVVDSCYSAFKFCDEQKSLNDDEARQALYNNRIQTIDVALLTPETSRVYQQILQKIIGEFNGKDAYKIDRVIALATKKKLEDF